MSARKTTLVTLQKALAYCQRERNRWYKIENRLLSTHNDTVGAEHARDNAERYGREILRLLSTIRSMT